MDPRPRRRPRQRRKHDPLLDKLIAEAPFPVRQIQVDGGAEFRAEFEAHCRARNLELFVLPPKRSDLNGAVERAQSTRRYEFCGCFDPPDRLERLNNKSTPPTPFSQRWLASALAGHRKLDPTAPK
jgi:hypothetical protein